MEATGVEPENPASQSAIDGRLCFLVIYSEDRERSLSLPHPATQVRRAEGAFKIDAGGEMNDRPTGEISFQRSSQTRLVDDSRHPPRRRRSPIAIAAKVQTGWACLPHALYLQAERCVLYLGVQHAPHKIALIRPQVQQTFVMFAGNGIFRIGKIEGDGAVFDNDSGA
jgi:hypothetical protein